MFLLETMCKLKSIYFVYAIVFWTFMDWETQ